MVDHCSQLFYRINVQLRNCCLVVRLINIFHLLQWHSTAHSLTEVLWCCVQLLWHFLICEKNVSSAKSQQHRFFSQIISGRKIGPFYDFGYNWSVTGTILNIWCQVVGWWYDVVCLSLSQTVCRAQADWKLSPLRQNQHRVTTMNLIVQLGLT